MLAHRCCHLSLLQAINAELCVWLAMSWQAYHSKVSPLRSPPLPCRAFCIEKNSTAPPLEVVGDASLRAVLVAPYVQYLVTEVLKNGMQVSCRCWERCWCAAGALLTCRCSGCICRCCWHTDGSRGVDGSKVQTHLFEECHMARDP